MSRIVTALEEAEQNIRTYAESVEQRGDLAARIRQHPAWYAIRGEAGGWVFGPSKFVGYRGMSAEDYLSGYSRQDGKETEPALAQWFERVDLHTALGAELRGAFEHFAKKHGKVPNARWRVSIPIPVIDEIRGRSATIRGIGDRIAFDAGIGGGRPHIRGTRIRVSDIVSALSEGETIEEILLDYPYLTRDDIFAALRYAARAVDHRVLTAA